MPDIDAICRKTNKGFDDLWEIDKEELRKQVRKITEEVSKDLHRELGLDEPWFARV